jgi:hypothetical protein
MPMQDETRRRGPKPGGPNPGGFRRGDDPRRACGLKVYDGMTLAAMARKLGPECLRFWHRAMNDESVPWKDRLRASELITDRGFGKAVTTLEVRSAQPIESLSRSELMAIASGMTLNLPITINGEAVEASTADLTADTEKPDVSP